MALKLQKTNSWMYEDIKHAIATTKNKEELAKALTIYLIEYGRMCLFQSVIKKDTIALEGSLTQRIIDLGGEPKGGYGSMEELLAEDKVRTPLIDSYKNTVYENDIIEYFTLEHNLGFYEENNVSAIKTLCRSEDETKHLHEFLNNAAKAGFTVIVYKNKGDRYKEEIMMGMPLRGIVQWSAKNACYAPLIKIGENEYSFQHVLNSHKSEPSTFSRVVGNAKDLELLKTVTKNSLFNFIHDA